MNARTLGLAALLALAGAVVVTAGDEKKPRTARVAAARDGIVAALGTTMEGGKPRALRVGDRVEKDQELLRLDDRLARLDLQQAMARHTAARADVEAAKAILAEAQARADRIQELAKLKAVSQEEVDATRLVRDRYRAEVVAKEEARKITEVEVMRARVVIEQHIVRSPVRGVVRAIRKHPGEGVRALEAVFEIVPEAAKGK